MNVLVIGSYGQLASEFKNSLKLSKVNFLFFGKKKLDILIYQNLYNKVKRYRPSIIINCAAYTNVDKSEIEKKKTYDLNCQAIKNLVKICRLQNIYLIHFSTDYVFNGKKLKYTEKNRKDPLSYYGKTKNIGEKIIIKNLKSFVIFRLSWLIGNYKNNFLKKICYNLKRKSKIFMVKDQISNPTTTIIVSKIVKICCQNYYNKKNILNGVFHLANEPSISKLDFTKFVYDNLKKLNLTNNNCEIIGISSGEIKNGAKRPLNTSFDLTKIKTKLKIKKLNWKNSIKKILIKF